MPKVTLGTMQIYTPQSGAGGNRSTGNITLDANVNDLFIGLAGNFGAGGGADYPDEVWWGTEGVAQQLSTEVLISAGLSNAEWVRIFRLRRPSPGTFAVWTALDVGTLASIAVLQVKGGAAASRNTNGQTDSANDLVTVSLTTKAGDLCVYMGNKQSGTPGWTGEDAQTSEIANSRMAYEIAMGTSASAVWGETGVDTHIVACGVSLKRCVASQVIIVQ